MNKIDMEVSFNVFGTSCSNVYKRDSSYQYTERTSILITASKQGAALLDVPAINKIYIGRVSKHRHWTE